MTRMQVSQFADPHLAHTATPSTEVDTHMMGPRKMSNLRSLHADACQVPYGIHSWPASPETCQGFKRQKTILTHIQPRPAPHTTRDKSALALHRHPHVFRRGEPTDGGAPPRPPIPKPWPPPLATHTDVPQSIKRRAPRGIAGGDECTLHGQWEGREKRAAPPCELYQHHRHRRH